MPRKPVQNVTEHRITLGEYERSRLNDFIKAKTHLQTAQAINAIAIPAACALGAGALGFGLYSIAKSLMDLDPTEGIRSWVNHYANNPSGGFNQAVQPNQTPYGSRPGEIGPEPPESLTAFTNWLLNPVYKTMSSMGIKPKERETV